MGLIRKDKTRKPGADYLYQATQLIGNFTYRETLPRTTSDQPIVDRYVLDLPNKIGQTAYVMMVPDERGRTQACTLRVAKGDTVQLYTPQSSRATMTKRALVSLNGSVSILVGETPVFVLFPPASSGRRVTTKSPLTGQ